MNKKNEISSPCISVCTVEEETGFCRGCFRSLEEIARWKEFSSSEREEILTKLDKRRVLYGNSFSHPYAT